MVVGASSLRVKWILYLWPEQRSDECHMRDAACKGVTGKWKAALECTVLAFRGVQQSLVASYRVWGKVHRAVLKKIGALSNVATYLLWAAEA